MLRLLLLRVLGGLPTAFERAARGMVLPALQELAAMAEAGGAGGGLPREAIAAALRVAKLQTL